MKQEARKIDYLVTARKGKLSRKIVWNSKDHLALDHPAGWKLSLKNSKISLVDTSTSESRQATATVFDAPTKAEEQIRIDIPPAQKSRSQLPTYLTISPLEPLQPPYKQISYDVYSNRPRQLLMYQGIRYFLLKYRPVGDQLTAHASDSSKIFHYEKTHDGYMVVPQKDSLLIKVKGKKIPLSVGVPVVFSESEFLNSSFIYGVHWWRFRSVATPGSLPPIVEEESTDDRVEKERMKSATVGTLVIVSLLMIFSGVSTLLSPPKKEAPTAKVEIKMPKVIAHKHIEEPKPPPPPPPPPRSIVKTEPVKTPPKRAAAPKAVQPVRKVAPKRVAKKPPALPAKTQARSQAKKASPAPPQPLRRVENRKPAPGVATTISQKAPPSPSQETKMLESLSFLSSGSKKPTGGSLEQYSKKNAGTSYMAAPSLGGAEKGNNTLSKITAQSGDTSINTTSSRLISAESGLGSEVKGLNNVQGKVSLNELYSGKGLTGFGDGAGVSVTGSGDLSEAEIEKALAKYISRFQFCYEKALLTDGTLAGNVRLQWDILPTGRAGGTKVINTQMNDQKLLSCITGVLKEVPFPKPRGGSVTAKKTFSFRSTVL